MKDGTLLTCDFVFGKQKRFYFKKFFNVGDNEMVLVYPEFGKQLPYNFLKSMVEVVEKHSRPLIRLSQEQLIMLVKKNNIAAKKEFINRIKDKK